MVELAHLMVTAVVVVPVLAWDGPRDAVTSRVQGLSRRLTDLERRRLSFFFDVETPPAGGGRAATFYLLSRAGAGLLGGAIMGLVAYGLAAAVILLRAWLFDIPDPGLADDPSKVTGATILVLAAPGLVLLYLAVQGMAGVIRLEGRLARRHLGPSATDLLRQRISELSTSRAGVVEAVDDERRRIERDLHDGVQQRVVALAMLLGRARRSEDPGRRESLLDAAHDESRRVIEDLRDVAWRVYPTALDSLGLEEALAGVAARSATPVRVSVTVGEPLPPAHAAVAYFVVSEAVTNVVKHAAATVAEVRVRRIAKVVQVQVSDDGIGGADRNGGGLSGLARRVAALDGRFDVTSPAGGPTVLVAEIPCE